MASRLILCLAFVLHLLVGLRGQNSSCRPTVSDYPLSPRIANYVMDVRLDTETKMVYGTSIIQWTNTSPDTVRDMHMYLYLNAFANANTSLLGNPGGSFGQDLSGRESIEWGGLTLSDIRQQGSQLDVLTSFVYPDEENFNDSSAVRLELPKRVLPGESTILTMGFQSKLPLIIGRSGYAENDFYHVVHWYPKVGVYEQDLSGDWGWNCHQFLPGMEFYGDFGNYDVTMNVPSDMVVGASGCLTEKSVEGDRCTYRYVAEDVIDFAWCASPDLEVVEDSWRHVDLRLLSAPAHHMLRERLMNAAKSALSYLDTHIGAYPYRTLTILDPPMHGLRSGFMEYPTYITGGAFTGWPKGVRTIESLVIHELTHQYFMQMLANNEKEEPWMDEGFVTYYEDRIMEHAYGSHSLFDLWGYRVSNQAFTRSEYQGVVGKPQSPIAIEGWKRQGPYKPIVYAKAALVLSTLEAHLGQTVFDQMMKTYFEANKFGHPRRKDFVKEVRLAFDTHQNALSDGIDQFLTQALDSTSYCDYGVSLEAEGEDYHLIIFREGSFVMPVEVSIRYTDGRSDSFIYDGKMPAHRLDVDIDQVAEVSLDPAFKIKLDVNRLNNSFVPNPSQNAANRYTLRVTSWLQHVFQVSSFLL